MTSRLWSATTALVFLISCHQRSAPDTDPPRTGVDAGAGLDGGADAADLDAGPGLDAGSDAGRDAPTQGACPLGAAAWTRAIGPARADQRSDLAVDAAGNVLFATQGAGPGAANGLTKLSPAGDVLFTRPFGSVVATDRAGNAFIAGSFTAPIDLGLGVLTPHAASDVFVAKLDAAGNVVLARALGLCGDGVQSIAVDATGRIAVSGAAMGTVVLDPAGSVLFTRALAGAVAFNARGDLIIAGSFTTAIDLGDGPISAGATRQGFVIALDRDGARRWSHVLTGSDVHVNGVAIDSADNVVIAGYYEGSIDLFGEELQAIFSSESGRVTGAYLAKLDASGQVLWKQGRAPGSEANGVAIDPRDAAIVAGAATGGAGFGRLTQASRFDAAGAPASLPAVSPASGYGRGIDVATDACGSVYLTVNALDLPSPASPLRAYVVKVTP